VVLSVYLSVCLWVSLPKWSDILKLDASNLVSRWTVTSTSQRKINWPLRGCGQHHMAHFLKSREMHHNQILH